VIETHPDTVHGSPTAVLCSGGLDSLVLAADLACSAVVQPIYVVSGFQWERGELGVVGRALAALPQAARIQPLAVLQMPVNDIYPPDHWALTGTPPAYDTPDEDVYLMGRNVALLGKAAVFCALRGIHRICLAPLAGNPFPDATPEFFARMANALSTGLAVPIRIDAPYREYSKVDVVRRGQALGVPLHLTVSCMNPRGLRHCGACSKCRERYDAFVSAGVADPTTYRVHTP
jgi:7-cyano-7-deazaguanine synthase